MKALNLYLLLAIIMLSVQSKAQDFQPPKNYSLKYSIDYAQYEKDVIRCVDWFENNPADKQKDTHDQVSRFLIQWIDGAPNVHVLISEKMVNMKSGKYTPLLVAFMGGWARYELAHQEKMDKVQAALAAMRCEFKVYRLGGMKKDKDLEKLIEMDKNGQLQDWAAKVIADFKTAK